MCQIFYVEKGGKFPSKETIKLEEEKNDHGSGVMWFEKVKGELKVFWEKGLTATEAYQLLKKVPLPAALHMRNSTSGGNDKKLTHPFAISADRDLQLALKGHADEAIMHNGTWHAWNEVLRYMVFASGKKVPRGPWSDSRAMAYLGAHHGPGLFDMVPINDGRLLWFDAKANNGDGWIWQWGDWKKGEGFEYSATLQSIATCSNYTKGYYQGSYSGGSSKSDPLVKGSSSPPGLTDMKTYTSEEINKFLSSIQEEAHQLGVLPAVVLDEPSTGKAGHA